MDCMETQRLLERQARTFTLSACWLLLLFVITLPAASPATAAGQYIGSEQCADCHRDHYRDWLSSGHHLQLRPAANAEHANIALPAGYQWKDIAYVVGGIKRKTNFVDQNGYLITAAKDGSKARTQYNLESENWSFYFPGKKKAYDCGPCHTTGYNRSGHQDGLPGIVGTWVEDGIGCEACHGPSQRHASEPRHATGRLVSAEICEDCHQRGGIDSRPFQETGLLRHHAQINELKLGAHKGLSCLNCHNPHKRASQAKDNCTICHSTLYHEFKNSVHGQAQIKCFECHMPRITQQVISRVSYIGEVRTHLFKINVDPEADMFTTVKDGGTESTFTKPFVTVEYVCLSCHGSRDKNWALERAKDFHKD